VRRLAEDVYQLQGFPRNAINVFLVGDVIVDAGTRHAAGRILRQVRGRAVNAHVLTHAHPDHQGSTHQLCETLAIPLWCGELDAPAAEDPTLMRAPKRPNLWDQVVDRMWTGPGHPVARRLSEGDEVGAGFRVLNTPGHTVGHIALWRETDRVLIAGDVLNGMHLATGRPGLHEPPAALSTDPARNRDSARRLADLRPTLVCFGHGPAWRGPEELTTFTAALPA
jgi:glyoxylase-like metal-dependent hydrolase (beta-lactamase superfamily II)